MAKYKPILILLGVVVIVVGGLLTVAATVWNNSTEHRKSIDQKSGLEFAGKAQSLRAHRLKDKMTGECFLVVSAKGSFGASIAVTKARCVP